MLRVGAGGVHRHLVRPPGALDRLPVDVLRPGPALRGAQHERGPARPLGDTVLPGAALNLVDLGDDRVQRLRHRLVHGLRVVALHEVRVVAVALDQCLKFRMRDPRGHRRVRDLVPVEVQDRQDRPVGHRIEELVGVPGGGQRPGLRLAVADHAGHDQVRVVEGRAERVRQGVPEFTALVDGTRRLRCHVRRDAAREGELLEKPPHPGHVLGDRRVPLGVSALKVSVGDKARPAVPGTGDIDDVEVPVSDHPVQVGVDQVQSWRGTPVPEQSRLHVLRQQFLGEQRIVEQVDLPDRQVVSGTPPGVDQLEFGRCQRPGLRRGHAGPLSRTKIRTQNVSGFHLKDPRPARQAGRPILVLATRTAYVR